TYGTATDQTVAGATPKLAKVASSFSAGKIPSENLDRIIQLDEDLAKYAAIVNQTPEYKDLVLQARSEEHTSELQSRFDLVCRLVHSTLFPYTTLFRSSLMGLLRTKL